MANPLHVAFIGATSGAWRVIGMKVVAGEPLDAVAAVTMSEGGVAAAAGATWVLRGVASHQRYVERTESDALRQAQPGLGRPEARRAALIPIKKSAEWWELPQDERRAIFETRSNHIAATLRFLPAVARRLHHARDLGEPFDFLTWFEFAPQHADLFDELLGVLRATEEWQYVEREIEIRLSREGTATP
jgi:hypothetical protein